MTGSADYLDQSNKGWCIMTTKYRRYDNLGTVSVMKNGLWSLARELCKTGCMIGHRRELWCRTLAVDTREPQVGTNWKHLLIDDEPVVSSMRFILRSSSLAC